MESEYNLANIKNPNHSGASYLETSTAKPPILWEGSISGLCFHHQNRGKPSMLNYSLAQAAVYQQKYSGTCTYLLEDIRSYYSHRSSVAQTLLTCSNCTAVFLVPCTGEYTWRSTSEEKIWLYPWNYTHCVNIEGEGTMGSWDHARMEMLNLHTAPLSLEVQFSVNTLLKTHL